MFQKEAFPTLSICFWWAVVIYKSRGFVGGDVMYISLYGKSQGGQEVLLRSRAVGRINNHDQSIQFVLKSW